MTRVTQQHVDARRQDILHAAARLFAQKGISGATMADIAREADLSAGAIYRYFPGKEELLRAVFDEAVRENQKRFQDAVIETESPYEALKAIGREVWLEEHNRDSLICDMQMVIGAARDPQDLGVDVTAMRRSIRESLEQLIRAAQAAGELDPEINPVTLSVILNACTNGIQMLKLEHDDDIDIEAAFDLFEQMVAGLKPQPTR
jgi:AcrR family transcriptional regulator